MKNPSNYEYCFSTSYWAGEYADSFGNNDEGSLTKWDFEGVGSNCWVPYDCTSGTCKELEMSGCWDASGNFQDGMVDNNQADFPNSMCTVSPTLRSVGSPLVQNGSTETRGASIGAGVGMISGAGALGFMAFRKFGKKRQVDKGMKLELSKASAV